MSLGTFTVQTLVKYCAVVWIIVKAVKLVTAKVIFLCEVMESKITFLVSMWSLRMPNVTFKCMTPYVRRIRSTGENYRYSL